MCVPSIPWGTKEIYLEIMKRNINDNKKSSLDYLAIAIHCVKVCNITMTTAVKWIPCTTSFHPQHSTISYKITANVT